MAAPSDADQPRDEGDPAHSVLSLVSHSPIAVEHEGKNRGRVTVSIDRHWHGKWWTSYTVHSGVDENVDGAVDRDGEELQSMSRGTIQGRGIGLETRSPTGSLWQGGTKWQSPRWGWAWPVRLASALRALTNSVSAHLSVSRYRLSLIILSAINSIKMLFKWKV